MWSGRIGGLRTLLGRLEDFGVLVIGSGVSTLAFGFGLKSGVIVLSLAFPGDVDLSLVTSITSTRLKSSEFLGVTGEETVTGVLAVGVPGSAVLVSEVGTYAVVTIFFPTLDLVLGFSVNVFIIFLLPVATCNGADVAFGLCDSGLWGAGTGGDRPDVFMAASICCSFV